MTERPYTASEDAAILSHLRSVTGNDTLSGQTIVEMKAKVSSKPVDLNKSNNIDQLESRHSQSCQACCISME